VPYPPEKASGPAADLPNPELNPMLNPVLGRHLGRWAQVYFTTPPEKRDEAIFDLLHELQAEERANGIREEVEEPVAATQEPATDLQDAALVCSRCHHRHARVQNFCGMCGAPLQASSPQDQVAAKAAAAAGTEQPNLDGLLTPSILFDPHHMAERREPSRSMIYADAQEPNPADSPVLEEVPVRRQAPVREEPTRPLSIVPRVEQEHPVDIDWLRERNLSGGDEEESGLGRRFLVILGGMAVVAGIVYAGLQYKSALRLVQNAAQHVAQSSPATSSIAPPPSAELSSSQHPGASATQPPAEKAASENRNARTPSRASEPAPTPVPKPNREPASLQMAGKTEVPSPAQASGSDATPQAATAAGAQELALAENYLSGKSGTRNSAVAAQLLWKAVSKENATAALLLSDLYAAGDGVPKSCDQARLLVDAALRKSIPGAAERLRNLQSCR
jgi:hypothetical protein